MTFEVTILENDDALSTECIERSLNGFELKFDIWSDDGEEEHEVKVRLKRVK